MKIIFSPARVRCLPLKVESVLHLPRTSCFKSKPIILRALNENDEDYSSEGLDVTETRAFALTEATVHATEEQLMQNDLEMAVNLLPEEFRQTIWKHDEHLELIELILDYGRKPIARFPCGDFILSDKLVTESHLHDAILAIGNFDSSNRAVLEGTLHRISCMRDRERKIYGLTIRIGRALTTKTAALVEEPLKAGKSILLIGPPGVGKTSAIRNLCKVLSEECKKRVIIVDTSNEIAGPGWVPHPSTGTCRRMHVTTRSDQHNVMVEAVQNHMPEVIVIDEIGKREECQAVRSIAQRGVQLLATTHGHTLENMLKDRVLRDLLGSVNDVILGDYKADVMGYNKKTILERVDASCFDVIVEMATRNRWRIHYSANEAVDAILAGFPPAAEVRYLDEDGKMVVERADKFKYNDFAPVNTAEPKLAVHETELFVPSEKKLQSNLETSSNGTTNADNDQVVFVPLQPLCRPNNVENPRNSKTLSEADRILNASSNSEILQANSNASKEELKECFKTVYQKVLKTENADKSVERARSRVQNAYKQLLSSSIDLKSPNQSLDNARLQEAQRILNASSDWEVLQANSTESKEELKECFKIVNAKVEKVPGENRAVQKARTRLQTVYEQRLAKIRKKKKAMKKPANVLALQEAERILNATSELDILKIGSYHTLTQLRRRLNMIRKTLRNVPGDDETITKARRYLDAAYKRVLAFHKKTIKASDCCL